MTIYTGENERDYPEAEFCCRCQKLRDVRELEDCCVYHGTYDDPPEYDFICHGCLTREAEAEKYYDSVMEKLAEIED